MTGTGYWPKDNYGSAVPPTLNSDRRPIRSLYEGRGPGGGQGRKTDGRGQMEIELKEMESEDRIRGRREKDREREREREKGRMREDEGFNKRNVVIRGPCWYRSVQDTISYFLPQTDEATSLSSCCSWELVMSAVKPGYQIQWSH